MAYQCAAIDQNNQCLEWVHVGFLGLPEINYEQAGQLCTAIALVLVAASGLRQ